MSADLGLLVVEQREAAVERGEVREGEVQVRVQAQQRELAEVRGVHVRHHVEQQPHHAPHHALEGGRELVGVLGGEHALVADRLLRVRHHVVHVLRRRHARLLAALVVPRVRAPARPRHVGARGRRAELRHGAVQQVHVVEQRQRCGQVLLDTNTHSNVITIYNIIKMNKRNMEEI